jgi:hypothetical protein
MATIVFSIAVTDQPALTVAQVWPGRRPIDEEFGFRKLEMLLAFMQTDSLVRAVQ